MDFTELIAVPSRTTFNIGLTPPSNQDMLGYFGHPILNGAYRSDGECGTVNNSTFLSRFR
jgi:hypothetical protein